MKNQLKVTSFVQLYELLTEEERIITDVLRQLIKDTLPAYCKEKISYNVPFFYGNKSICLVWPASIPRGGIKEGVLLAFWYGNRLPNKAGYLKNGTNKQVYYRIFLTADELDEEPLIDIIREAAALDMSWKNKSG